MTTETVFLPGDEVIICEGELKGFHGTVSSYEEMFDLYLVELPELSTGHYFGFKYADMEKLDPFQGEAEQVLPFGMSSRELAAYADNFLQSTMDRIQDVGDKKHGQKGFQSFEGRDLVELFDKTLEEIEDVAGYLATLHIRVRRLKFAVEGS